MVIISRKELVNKIKTLRKVVLYGRRKTGKTFLVKNFVDYDYYFFVKRDGSIRMEVRGSATSKLIDYNTLITILELNRDKITVIDEFHRLPALMDELHRLNLERNILLSSTSWYLNALLKHENPLLEYAKERMSLASPSEVISSLESERKEDLIESAVFLREVFLAPYYTGRIREDITNFLYNQRFFLDSLVKDIFIEERKEIGSVYLRILRLIADGKTTYHEVYDGVKDIAKGQISSYLNTLIHLDFIRVIPEYGKVRKKHYEIKSPVLYLHFYLDSKYNYLEEEVPKKFIRRVVNEKMNMLVEKFFRDLMEEWYGMRSVKITQPEIDIALMKFNKLHLVGEVKWGKIKKEDVMKVVKNLSHFPFSRLMIVRDKGLVEPYEELLKKERIRVMDAGDFLNEVMSQTFKTFSLNNTYRSDNSEV